MALALQLNKTIKVGNREVTELQLREPIARDFFVCGLPMAMLRLEEGREFWAFEFRMKPLAMLIGRLAGIPPDAVKTMSMRDIGQCQSFILGFLDTIKGASDHVR